MDEKAEDIPIVAEDALKDGSGLSNPQQASFEATCPIYQSVL
ncbi:hypothetical protein [Shewanella sp. OMA3-2]